MGNDKEFGTRFVIVLVAPSEIIARNLATEIAKQLRVQKEISEAYLEDGPEELERDNAKRE